MKEKLYIETNIRSLYSYLEDLRIGTLQIPAFQRGFVWERDNIKDLFDSIKLNSSKIYADIDTKLKNLRLGSVNSKNKHSMI